MLALFLRIRAGLLSLSRCGQLGYRLHPKLSATLAVFNLLDTDENDITYFYTSRLDGEAAEGVDDFHLHPVEPRSLRLTLTGRF